jgi:tetratricopeptide (TPR) repeat protein
MYQRDRVISSLRDIALTQAQMNDSQAALETCRKALKLIEKVGTPNQKAVSLRDIAGVQAVAGDVIAAQQTAEVILEPSYQEQAIASIIRAQAGSGDYEGALQTVEKLARPADALMSLARIADAQAKAGQVEQARQLAHLAKAKAKALSPRQASHIGDTIARSIVAAQAKSGNFAEAFQTLKSVNNPRIRSSLISVIAKEQENRGDLTGALETLMSSIEPTPDVLVTLAHLKAKSGDPLGALQIAEKISEPLPRVSAYLDIARAQAETGDNTAATASLETMLTASKQLPPAFNPSQFKGKAAIVYATIGNYSRAIELVQAGDSMSRSFFLIQIGRMRAKTGDVAGAIAMAKQMGSHADQANGLIGVAEGLMDR